MCENGHIAVVKCYPIQKNMKKDFKTFPELNSQVHSQTEARKQERKKLFMKVEPLSQMVQNQFGQANDNNDTFFFLKILSFLCCWYLVEKKNHMKGERAFFISTHTLFKSPF